MAITAGFSYTLIGLTASFTDESISDLPITYWYWDFGVAGWSEDQNPSGIVFPSTGTFPVNLYIEDGDGNSSDITIDVYIPSVDFTMLPLNESDSFNIQFSDISGEVSANWDWDFGDGEVGVVQNPVHRYLMEGVYTVTLTNDSGSIEKQIEVRDVSGQKVLTVGGYDPDNTVGVIYQSLDAGSTWNTAYEYPGDSKITSIISL